MQILFEESKTKENLMRAFAGESQARNRYTFASKIAKKEGLYVIESVFTFTAGQEYSHAKAFYDKLKDVKGVNISVDGNYPVDVYDDIIKLLRSAEHNEYMEYSDDYAGFANIAKEEGFNDISNLFSMIANIEKTHHDRFKAFADMLENNTLYVSDIETKWMCLNCGYIYNGTKPPLKCPVCSHPKGYFIKTTLSPYNAF